MTSPVAGGRRRLRRRGSTPGRPPRADGRPARGAARASPDAGSLGGGAHRRRRPRRRRRGRAHRRRPGDATAREATRARALRDVLWAELDRGQPGRPRRRRRPRPDGLRARGRGAARGRRGRRGADDRLLRRLLRPSPGGVHEVELAAAQAIAAAVQAQHKPVVVHTIFPHSPTAAVLRRPGSRCTATSTGPAPCWPGCEEHLAPAVRRAAGGRARRSPTRRTTSARGLFADAGHRLPRGAHGRESRDELVDAFAATGFPLVLKALGQVHKSDAGGVVLGLRDEHAALAAYDDLVGPARPAGGLRRGDGRPRRGVELIVGLRARPHLRAGRDGRARRHPRRGAGRHGAARSRPSTSSRPGELVLSLRGAPLLSGARGRTPGRPRRAAPARSAPSRAWRPQHPELAELEVNPLLALPDGPLALDARVVLGRPRSALDVAPVALVELVDPARPWPGTPRGRRPAR